PEHLITHGGTGFAENVILEHDASPDAPVRISRAGGGRLMKTAPPRHTIVPGCFCLLASILAFPRPVAALGGHWLSGGPWGGEVYALAGDPQDPSILLAGTYSGGLYRSTDGAASWAKVDGIPDDGFYQYVDDVAFDPVDQTRVYAAVNDCCSE